MALAAVWVALPLARLDLLVVGGHPVQPADALLVLTYLLAGVWAALRWWSARTERAQSVPRVKGTPPVAGTPPGPPTPLAQQLASDRAHLRAYLAAAVALVAAFALSLLVSRGPASAWIKLAAHGAQLGTPLLTLAVVGDDARRFRLLVAGAAVGLGLALVAGLVSIVVYYLVPGGHETAVCTWGALPPAAHLPRVCWPFYNPNLLASYLTATVPLLLLIWSPPAHAPAPLAPSASGVRPAAAYLGAPLSTRASGVVLVAAALAVAAVAPLTFSTQMGGLVLALAIALRAHLRLRGARAAGLLAGALAVALLLALAVTSYPVGGRLQLWDGPRVAVWRAALATAAAHPWFGRGYGAPVALVQDPRATGYHADWETQPPAPHWRDGHDVWLDVLGQAGLFGLTAFVLLALAVARRTAAISDARLRAPLAGALTGCFLYGGLFDATQEARHLWPLVGLALAAARLPAGTGEEAPRSGR